MALIPPTYPDCVVAIGIEKPDGSEKWVASGFLYGHVERHVDADHVIRKMYLVSNRHVLVGKKKVLLRFNPQGNEPARTYPAELIRQE